MSPANATTLTPSARVRVPEHVVFRSFAAETVVLNLDTGLYHGLNRTAGLLLERLDVGRSVAEAALGVATEFGQPADEVERDCVELCRELHERGLIELVP